MKIALVTDFYLPSLGGLQTSTVNQRKALENSGNEVFVFTAKYDKAEPTDDSHVIRVTSRNMPGLGFPVVSPSEKLKSFLLKEFSKRKIDVIHIQTEFGLAQTAMWAGNELGIPVFYTSHTYSWKTAYPIPRLQAKVIQIFYRFLFGTDLKMVDSIPGEDSASRALRSIRTVVNKRADVLICPSKHMFEALNPERDQKPGFVVPNPVTAISKLAPRPLPEVVRFVWPSRIEPEKRILEFIEAVLIANKLTKIPFFVDIIGEGALLEKAKLLAEGAKNIKFHGRLTQDQTVTIMDKDSLVVISSSGYDNQPMIIAEALSRDRGVLYCDPNLNDSLKKAGYLSGDQPKQLARAIKELVEDPSKIKALAEAAKVNKDQFSEQTYSQTITDLYKKFASK
ncbi:MAG TPA: glycosyltransferase [Candidatus Saccharimonadales bacterium]|nr:glycosyltransferase [Candidatus Saccharimonadales bacterium]